MASVEQIEIFGLVAKGPMYCATFRSSGLEARAVRFLDAELERVGPDRIRDSHDVRSVILCL